jgi:hypothetical protein
MGTTPAGTIQATHPETNPTRDRLTHKGVSKYALHHTQARPATLTAETDAGRLPVFDIMPNLDEILAAELSPLLKKANWRWC